MAMQIILDKCIGYIRRVPFNDATIHHMYNVTVENSLLRKIFVKMVIMRENWLIGKSAIMYAGAFLFQFGGHAHEEKGDCKEGCCLGELS